MANTHHTGIPKLQWSFEYPPCTPSITIVADKNPFCLGDSVTFTPTLNCVDTATIESYEIKYGALYNWYAATDVRNIAAEGWEVPTLAQIATLVTYLGGNAVAAGHLKEIGTTYWNVANADNSSNFNSRGSAQRLSHDGSFSHLNEQFHAWSVTENLGTYYSFENQAGTTAMSYAYRSPKYGHSIRLIKTTTTLTHGQTGTYTGNDGKVYRTICIGTQEWLADNLAETLYRDLTPIPEVTDNAEWAALEDGAMCYYNNDINNAYTYTNYSEIISYGWVVNGSIQSTSAEPFVTNTLTNGNSVYMFFITSTGQTYFSNLIVMQESTEACITLIKYGLLYNWYAATDERNICAEGWDISTEAEFDSFGVTLGGNSVAGGKLKETGFTYFISPNTGATNELNFNGRGTSYRNGTTGDFNNSLGLYNYFWSKTEFNLLNARFRYLSYNNTIFDGNGQGIIKKNGCSIRPTRPATPSELSLTDGTSCAPYVGNDGKTYPTVKIGTQVWLAANLAETKFRNGDYIHGYEGGSYQAISNAAWANLTDSALCAYNDDLNNV